MIILTLSKFQKFIFDNSWTDGRTGILNYIVTLLPKKINVKQFLCLSVEIMSVCMASAHTLFISVGQSVMICEPFLLIGVNVIY